MAFVQVASTGDAPTFFEMVAAERLMPSLKAAVTYALSVSDETDLSYTRVCAESFPDTIIYHTLLTPQVYSTRPNVQRFLDHEDELFFLISVALNRHSLQQKNASFAESLYALHRFPSEATPGLPQSSSSLTSRDRWQSLVLLTLLPYIRAKMDAFYNRSIAEAHFARDTSNEDNTTRPTVSYIGHLFTRGYPYCAAAFEAGRFAYQLLYLLGRSPHYSPELHLLGLVVRRVSGQDVATAKAWRASERAKRLQASRDSRVPFLMRFILEGWVRLSDAAVDHTHSALVLMVFGYKVRYNAFSASCRYASKGGEVGAPRRARLGTASFH